MMLMELFREVRNTFWDGYCETGELAGEAGSIRVSEHFPENTYVLFNGPAGSEVLQVQRDDNGYFIRRDEQCSSETVTGSVYRLKVPKDFVEFAQSLEGYIKSNGNQNVVSERFGEYSYTLKETGGWETVFRKSLDRYRKMTDGLLEILNG